MSEKDQFEARMVAGGMPTSCCDYGVVSLTRGVEVCRVWEEEDARTIARLLNEQTRPAPKADGLVEEVRGVLIDKFGASDFLDVPEVAEKYTETAMAIVGKIQATMLAGVDRLAALASHQARSGLGHAEGIPNALSHDEALDAITGCAATVTVLSYQEAIEGYLKLRGIPL